MFCFGVPLTSNVTPMDVGFLEHLCAPNIFTEANVSKPILTWKRSLSGVAVDGFTLFHGWFAAQRSPQCSANLD